MSGGGGSAPEPDPRIGEAALKSAKLGEDYLGFMRKQAAVTNNWAEQDRSRYRSVYEPLQDEFIADARKGPDYGKVAGDVRRAKAATTQQFDAAQGQTQRRMSAMGVNPASGRARSVMRGSDLAEAAATAGSANATRLQSRTMAEGKADAKMASAINMGSGLAVNPGTSMGLANSTMGAGFSGAMQGQRQMGSMLNTQYDQQMDSYNAQQAQSNSLMSGLGSAVGLWASSGFAIPSSKEYKTNKKPTRRSLLKAVNKMPVEEWDYKDGIADGGRHVGAYAEDFKKATGQGDGRSIPVGDALGVTMGAVQELSKKVDILAKGNGHRKPRSVSGARA